MKSTVSFLLPKTNHNTIKDMGSRSVSAYMEDAFKDFLDGKIEINDEDLENVRTSCTTNVGIATRLQEKADALGIPVSKLARVIADKSLATRNEHNQHLDYQEGLTADRRTPKNQIHQDRATYNVTRT